MSDPLLNPGNSLLTLTQVNGRVDELDDRHGLTARRLESTRSDVTAVGVGIVILTIIILVLGYFAYDANGQLAQLRAQQQASDIARVQDSAALRGGACTLIDAIRSTYSNAARDSYPGGTGAYDTLFKQIAAARTTTKCGP